VKPVESFTTPVNVLVEGITDEAVARRLLDHVGLRCGTVYGKEGKAALVQRLPNYNQAARFAPWLVVVDLDRDADCAPPFVDRVLPHPAGHMFLRVAVRAVEAWLLADGERIAAFLGVRAALIPRNPDAEDDPKAALVSLARRSRWRTVREDMVPREGSGGRVGPGYAGRLIEFVAAGERSWRPDVAVRRSDSLRRCVETLRTLQESTFHSSPGINKIVER
jgi:hypothetical protein